MDLPEGLILDVTPGPDARYETEILRSLGHPVLICHGPDRGVTCPVLDGTCAKLDAAHGVVFALNLDRPMHRAILRRYVELIGHSVPIQVVVHPGQDQVHADVLHGLRVWTRRPTEGELNDFAAVVKAADRDRAPAG